MLKKIIFKNEVLFIEVGWGNVEVGGMSEEMLGLGDRGYMRGRAVGEI